GHPVSIAYNPTAKDFPKYARTMVELIGVEKTLQYTQTYGGHIVYFRAWQDDKSTWKESTSNLVKIIGVKLAKKVVAEFKGESFTMPRCSLVMARVTSQRILDDYFLNGFTSIQLSKKYKRHERRIRQIIEQHQREWIKVYKTMRLIQKVGVE
ncbi:MAG: Mor transcription activator family protein, partial [Mariprofundaceae bacterium]|nr:Mor transcription activator family protein [Mariprofundaceae bacterium]